MGVLFLVLSDQEGLSVMGWEAQLEFLIQLSAQRPFRRRAAQLAWRGRHDDDSRDYWRCGMPFTRH